MDFIGDCPAIPDADVLDGFDKMMASLVIARSLPQFQHVVMTGGNKTPGMGILFNKSIVVRNDRFYRSLLKHYF